MTGNLPIFHCGVRFAGVAQRLCSTRRPENGTTTTIPAKHFRTLPADEGRRCSRCEAELAKLDAMKGGR